MIFSQFESEIKMEKLLFKTTPVSISFLTRIDFNHQ